MITHIQQILEAQLDCPIATESRGESLTYYKKQDHPLETEPLVAITAYMDWPVQIISFEVHKDLRDVKLGQKIIRAFAKAVDDAGKDQISLYSVRHEGLGFWPRETAAIPEGGLFGLKNALSMVLHAGDDGDGNNTIPHSDRDVLHSAMARINHQGNHGNLIKIWQDLTRYPAKGGLCRQTLARVTDYLCGRGEMIIDLADPGVRYRLELE